MSNTPRRPTAFETVRASAAAANAKQAPSRPEELPEKVLKFPEFSAELVEHLEKLYPPIVPVPSVTSADALWYDAGKQDVISTLRKYLDRKE